MYDFFQNRTETGFYSTVVYDLTDAFFVQGVNAVDPTLETKCRPARFIICSDQKPVCNSEEGNDLLVLHPELYAITTTQLTLSHNVPKAPYTVYLVSENWDGKLFHAPIRVEVCGYEGWVAVADNAIYKMSQNISLTGDPKWVTYNLHETFLPDTTTRCWPHHYKLCNDSLCEIETTNTSFASYHLDNAQLSLAFNTEKPAKEYFLFLGAYNHDQKVFTQQIRVEICGYEELGLANEGVYTFRKAALDDAAVELGNFTVLLSDLFVNVNNDTCPIVNYTLTSALLGEGNPSATVLNTVKIEGPLLRITLAPSHSTKLVSFAVMAYTKSQSKGWKGFVVDLSLPDDELLVPDLENQPPYIDAKLPPSIDFEAPGDVEEVEEFVTQNDDGGTTTNSAGATASDAGTTSAARRRLELDLG